MRSLSLSIGSVLTALQALHTPEANEFFRVHCEQVQNSPFRSVISSTDDMLFSFEPPHTMQA